MVTDIRKPLKKFLPHLLQAQAQNLNEADTVLRLIKFFEDVLGWDPLTDISREANFKNKFVDVVLKVEGVVKLLVEAKAAGETLRDRHIEQAERYAAENNFHWVLLTNGVVWNLYHLTFDEGIEYERAFTADLSDAESMDSAFEKIALLHKQSIRKNAHEEFWERAAALNPASIGKAMFHEDILSGIRRELRRATGLLIDQEDLANAMHNMLSPEARERIGPMRIYRKRAAPHRRNEATGAPASEGGVGEATEPSEMAPAPEETKAD